MEAMGLPMSFGKKAKSGKVNVNEKVESTRRGEEVRCCRSVPPLSPMAPVSL